MPGWRRAVGTLLLWTPLVIFVLFGLSGVLLGSMGMGVHWTSKEAPISSRLASSCSFAPAWRQVANWGKGQKLEASYRKRVLFTKVQLASFYPEKNPGFRDKANRDA